MIRNLKMFPQVGYDSNFLVDEGQVVGIDLGADCTAEHESGTGVLRESLGIGVQQTKPVPGFLARIFNRREKIRGVPARQMTKLPADYTFIEKEGESYLSLGAGPHLLQKLQQSQEGRPLVAAWSCSGIGILARGADSQARLRVIHEAFQAKDIALLSLEKFLMRGLGLVLVSKLPPEVNSEMVAKELAAEDRERRFAIESVGLEETLRANQLTWFSLRFDHVIENKDGNMCIWLNPRDQRQYNSGWFTAEDLWAWSRNQGPVVSKGR